MKERRKGTSHPVRHGAISRGVLFMSRRGFTAFDALMIPFHLLYAGIMLATPTVDLKASRVFGELNEIAPINIWATLLIVLAVIVTAGIVSARWHVARIGYVFIAGWWFSITALVYLATPTLLSPAVYGLIGVVCLYRQAEIAVGYKHGGE